MKEFSGQRGVGPPPVNGCPRLCLWPTWPNIHLSRALSALLSQCECVTSGCNTAVTSHNNKCLASGESAVNANTIDFCMVFRFNASGADESRCLQNWAVHSAWFTPYTWQHRPGNLLKHKCTQQIVCRNLLTKVKFLPKVLMRASMFISDNLESPSSV